MASIGLNPEALNNGTKLHFILSPYVLTVIPALSPKHSSADTENELFFLLRLPNKLPRLVKYPVKQKSLENKLEVESFISLKSLDKEFFGVVVSFEIRSILSPAEQGAAVKKMTI